MLNIYFTSSGSSSGSGSMQHSFSVDEIQKVRTQLKSSKSYPNDFLLKQQKHSEEVVVEDCDNSSSGVSSDQEVPVGPPTAFDDRLSADQTSMTLPSPKNQTHRAQIGLSRNAVSLAQLPPPIEGESEEKEDIFVPPPPEFEGGANGAHAPEPVVLAPPPQFSDNRQVSRVRIVGAVPKSNQNGKQGRLHSQ